MIGPFLRKPKTQFHLGSMDEIKSMKSRHATVSVDAMLEALQRTAAVKVKIFLLISYGLSSFYAKKSHDFSSFVLDLVLSNFSKSKVIHLWLELLGNHNILGGIYCFVEHTFMLHFCNCT